LSSLKRQVLSLWALGVTALAVSSSLSMFSQSAHAAELETQAREEASLIAAELNPTETEVSCRLTRVNLLVGVFAEIELGILSLKIKPYVELRFNRR